MVIGKKTHDRHKWCAGIEISTQTPTRLGFSPRLEIWCYKIVKYPKRGEAFNKKTDIKGFWKIVWIEKIGITKTSTLKAKGFRDQKVEEKRSKINIRTW